MKKIIIVLALIITILSVTKEETITIPKNSIRFRVIANSNSKEDQKLKKEIIKNLTADISNLELNSNNIEESRNNIEKQIPIINKTIEKTIKENNSDQTYEINYGMNYFPEKKYKGTVYKEGNYESLVITLGKGSGKNFWCVLFPPLCLLEAENKKDTTKVEYKSFVKEIIDKYF